MYRNCENIASAENQSSETNGLLASPGLSTKVGNLKVKIVLIHQSLVHVYLVYTQSVYVHLYNIYPIDTYDCSIYSFIMEMNKMCFILDNICSNKLSQFEKLSKYISEMKNYSVFYYMCRNCKYNTNNKYFYNPGTGNETPIP